MSGSGRENPPDVRKWSADLTGCAEVLGGTLGCLGMVGRPAWMSRSGRDALWDVRE